MDGNIEYEEEIHILDYVYVLAKHYRLIILFPLFVSIATGIRVYYQPEIFRATASIMQPKEAKTKGLSGLLSQGGSLGGLMASFSGGSPSSSLIRGLLRSRLLIEKIVDKFNFKDLYKVEFKEDVIETFGKNLTVEVSKEGIIFVSFDDRDPVFAAKIVNATVEELDRINNRLNVTTVTRQRKFLEERLVKVKEDLVNAENELKTFRERNKTISLTNQAKAQIQAAADIRGEILSLKIKLSALKLYATKSNKEVLSTEIQIKELEKATDEIENSRSSLKRSGSINIPLSDFPDLELKLIRLKRELKTQGSLYEMLTQQYEMAKIEEVKDISTIQNLDKAVPPRRRIRPLRRKKVIISGLASLFIVIFAVFILEFFRKIKEEDYERWQKIKKCLK